MNLDRANTILECMSMLGDDILREAISAGDLVAVVGSGQIGDMGGASLHVSSNAVPETKLRQKFQIMTVDMDND